MANAAASHRPRMLLVEDNFLVGHDLSETARDLGIGVDGPFARRQDAIAAIEDALPDFAVLDIYNEDGEVYPLADMLADAGVPIIFYSGHVAPDELADRYPAALACAKPTPPDRIIAMMTNALQQGSAAH